MRKMAIRLLLFIKLGSSVDHVKSISVDKFLLRSNDSIFLGSTEIMKRESDLTVRQIIEA